MKRPVITMIAAAAATTFVACNANADDYWFDAGISQYDAWPADGTDKTVEGQGVWEGTANATLDTVQKKLDILSTSDSSLDFCPALQKEVGSSGTMKLSFSARFTASEWLPDPIQGDKCALAARINSDGTATNYCAVALDAAGGTNAWTVLEGPTPVTDQEVALEINLKREAGRSYARYRIGGTVLTLGGSEWIETADSQSAVGKVVFCGRGSLSALAAEDPAPVEMVELTIPSKDNISIASVRVAGVDVPLVEGTYRVPAGSVVTVVFKPAAGYAIGGTASTVTYVVFDNLTLAAEDIPDAINVAQNLTINEIMAKNGVSLATEAGKTELDWVELHNSGDDDINLAGWYLSDDPSEQQSDWAKIQGNCVVPAHGYKIVWANNDFTGTANEAWTAIGLSTGGENLFLADPEGNIIHRVDFPAQMEDISYGLGHIERTVLSASDPAQYRIGDGEWHSVTGSVGMCGSTNGFTVTAYQMASSAFANLDAAKACVAAGRYTKRTVTNNVQTIAYQQDGSRTEFAPYTNFSTLGLSSDYYVVVVEGAVYVPRAGSWTFSVGSDDGFSLELFNDRYSFASEYSGGRSYGQSPSAFHIPEPGVYNVRLFYFEKTGGATLDFSVAEGDYTDFESEDYGFNTTAFKLVGSAASGVTHAGRWAAYASNDVTAEMQGVSDSLEWKTTFSLEDAPSANDTCKLNIRFADGFIATLNGTVVASAVANGPRTLAEALTPVSYEFNPLLLVKGENTLVVTASNNAVSDNEFFLSPEISIKKGDAEYVYFKESTPGAANTTAGWGAFTPKVQFSVPHGWKDEPFEVALSCEAAPNSPIYYTLDGTSPTTSSRLYTGPISVSGTTCIRASVPQRDSVQQIDSSATYLFADDVIAQPRNVAPYGFPASEAVNSQVMRFGMSESLVSSNRERILNGLTNEIATISLVIDLKNLFDPVSGIYVNPTGDGRSWERNTMVEQIDPVNAKNGFSTGAGLRIRGAFSRNVKYPKHSLRLLFRSEYAGENKLDFKLFGDEGADKFKKVDLRTSQNYSWSNGQTGDTFVHDVFSRDSQRDMGVHYARSRYYHLFINGQYWGLYQTEERGDDNYAESYNGGDADNYDVIKTSQPGYVTGANEGTIDAWQALWDIAVNQGFTGSYSNNYQKAMGLNPDWTRNPDYPVYLNPTNLAVYMLSSHYVVDSDCPASTGDRNKAMANNIYAIRDRVDGDGKSDGFFFLRHDAEHSMGVNTSMSRYTDDPTIYGNELWNANFKKLEAFNPSELNYKLAGDKASGKAGNPEYKMLLADLFYKHCLRPGGALTAEKSRARFESRMAEIENSIMCEIARWRTGSSVTYGTWTNACDKSLTFIDNRTTHMLSQYRTRGWYPTVDAPEALDAPDGTRLADGAFFANGGKVYVSNVVNTVYWTTDGSDPRLAGGEVNPSATVYDGGIEVPQGKSVIKMRAISSKGEWSALEEVPVEGEVLVPPDQALGIRVAAVYSSTADNNGDGSEFIVLTNLLDHAVSLKGLHITCTKTPKPGKQETPSLDLTLNQDIVITSGGMLKLAKSDYWPSMKITNGAVDMLVYDSDGTTIQTLHFEAAWWNNACKNTGAYFVALEFGDTVTSIEQWTYPSDQVLGIRVAAVYSSTVDNSGDGSEFIILTNVLNRAVSLKELRITCTKTPKPGKQETSSLDLTITNDIVITSGGTLKFTKADDWPSKKITNGAVDMLVYDSVGATVQTLHFDANWWSAACDGTGEYFVALEFGETVKSESQWTHRAPASADWPADPETEITQDTTPADLGIATGAFTNAAPAELKQLAKWAKKYSVPFGGEAVNGMSFDANGNPATVFEEAYLLNCAVDDVEAKKALFNFDKIVPGTVPSIPKEKEDDYNGTVHVFGSASLENGGDWSEDEEAKASARFFKAILTR